jgi:hypothetical protein
MFEDGEIRGVGDSQRTDEVDGQGLRARSSNGGVMGGRRVTPCFAAGSREGAARGLL